MPELECGYISMLERLRGMSKEKWTANVEEYLFNAGQFH